jgi:hypothetical protein
MRRMSWLWVVAALSSPWSQPVLAAEDGYEYKLLATSKTSTMEKELNEAADAGYRFEAVMGGETSFGGKEVVSILSRPAGPAQTGKYQYKLCATSKTGTMQKEMSEAADAGYIYRDQTVSETLFGGKEVIVIMERERDQTGRRVEYKLLATNKTSTMQKELAEVAAAGFRFAGVTVGKTTFGGNEVVVITERRSSGAGNAAAAK